MTSLSLLDANVLVALLDPDHVHHDAAHAWFGRYERHGWASCALTELALVRVLCSPAYTPTGMRARDAASLLRELQRRPTHAWWPVDASLLDSELFDLDRVTGHRQVTDLLLLGLAVSRKARLATFDRSIPWRACRPASEGDVVVIPA